MLPKHLLRNTESNNLLIFDEKHCRRYFVCNNTQEFTKAAMKILKERLEAGWYFDEEDDFSAETAEYCGYLKRFPKPIKDETSATRIVTDNNFEAALEFIHSRSDYEYEGVRFEKSEDL